MNETSTTMNNTTTRTTLHTLLRALVCMVLLAVCVPGVGENVAAATKVKVGDITEKGEVIVAASKKKGESYKDAGFPADIFDNTSGSEKIEDTDDAYSFSTETGGTLTLEYSMTCKKDASYETRVAVVNANNLTAEPLLKDSGQRETGYSNSVSIILSPGKYIISSYFMNDVKASLNVYFNAYQIGITIPETIEMQKGDAVSLNDVLTTDPIEFLGDYKSAATWASSDENVATVDKDGKVAAVGAGTADITITLPGNATATCSITVAEPVGNATDIIPTTVKLSKTSYTWSGKAKKPTVTVLDQNGNEIPASSIVLKTYYSNTEVGTAKVFVAVTGTTQVQEDGTTYAYHAATFVKEFKIKAAKAKKVTVKKTITYKGSSEWVYDSSVKHRGYFENATMKQKATVYDSKGKKISAKHYTVTYSQTCHAGKVKVTVKMDKCYGSKKLTTKYTIKVNSKTAKLFPKKSYFAYVGDGYGGYYGYGMDGVSSPSFSYTKQPTKFMKKLLKYGNLDVVDDVVDYIPEVNTKTVYKYDGMYDKLAGSGDPLKFTGTIGDLIQCFIKSKIVKIDGRIYCEDGTEYSVNYWNSMFGMKSGYVAVNMINQSTGEEIWAYIKP